MDVRKTYPGGEIGISSNELNFMPNSNREGIHALGNGIGSNTNMIVSGVNAVINIGVDCQVQDGFVYLNGEVLKVDAQTVPSTIGDLYEFQKVTTNTDPEGERNFRDLTTSNVYEKNRAVVVNVASVTSLSVDGDTIVDVLKSLIQVQSNWNETDTNDPSFIQNKPSIITQLLQGKVKGIDVGGGAIPTVEGDFTSLTVLNTGGDDIRLKVFFNNIGTVNYHPIVTIVSQGANWDADNDVKLMTRALTSTSIEILMKEDLGNVQNLDLIITFIPYSV